MRIIKLYCLDAVALQKVGERPGRTVTATESRVDQIIGESSALERSFDVLAEFSVLTAPEVTETDGGLPCFAGKISPSERSRCQEDDLSTCVFSFTTSSFKRIGPVRVSMVWPGSFVNGSVE